MTFSVQGEFVPLKFVSVNVCADQHSHDGISPSLCWHTEFKNQTK